jgi:hypothetical protein
MVKKSMSIKWKGAFFLAVFGLNTVVGFACAVGLNMDFNSHQHDEEATEVHVHKDGKIHHHKKEPQSHTQKHKDKKDDCCNDKVIKFEQINKTVPPSSNTGINPEAVTTFIFLFFNTDVLYASQHIPNIRYFVRCYHPPIPDIRIAIQSFQI